MKTLLLVCASFAFLSFRSQASPLPQAPMPASIVANVAEVAERTPDKSLLYLHGILMFLAWGVLMPFGAWLASVCKTRTKSCWFHLHWVLQALGLVTASVGFAVAFRMVPNSTHLTKPHHIMGVVVMAVAYLHLFVAVLFRPAPPEKHELKRSTTRLIWKILHANLGRLLMLLALITGGGGLFLPGVNASDALKIAFFAWTGFVVALYTATVLITACCPRMPPPVPAKGTAQGNDADSMTEPLHPSSPVARVATDTVSCHSQSGKSVSRESHSGKSVSRGSHSEKSISCASQSGKSHTSWIFGGDLVHQGDKASYRSYSGRNSTRGHNARRPRPYGGDSGSTRSGRSSSVLHSGGDGESRRIPNGQAVRYVVATPDMCEMLSREGGDGVTFRQFLNMERAADPALAQRKYRGGAFVKSPL